MNQRGRSLLFMLAATVLNMILTVLFFGGTLALYSATFGRFLKLKSAAFPIIAAFALAVAGSALVYRKILAAIRKRKGLAERWGLSGSS